MELLIHLSRNMEIRSLHSQMSSSCQTSFLFWEGFFSPLWLLLTDFIPKVGQVPGVTAAFHGNPEAIALFCGPLLQLGMVQFTLAIPQTSVPVNKLKRAKPE